jgi:WD40 repeat protein
MYPFLCHLGAPVVLLVIVFSLGTAAGQTDPPVIRCPAGRLQTFAFSSDSKLVAAAYYDLQRKERSLGVWESNGLRRIFVDRAGAGFKGTEAIALSGDNKCLLRLGDGGDENEVHIWDIASGNRIKEMLRKRERHDPNSIRTYPTRELLETPDGRWLLHDVIAGLVTNVITGEVVLDYDKKYSQRVRFVYGGIIVSDSAGGPENVYDVVTGKLVTSLPPIKGVLSNFLHYSKDGKTRSVYCDAEGMTLTRGRSPTKTVIAFDVTTKQPHATRLSPDGRWLAVSYQYGKDQKKPVPSLFPREYEYQQLYDTNTGRAVGAPLGGMDVYFSPDGSRLAVLSKDGDVAITKGPGPVR